MISELIVKTFLIGIIIPLNLGVCVNDLGLFSTLILLKSKKFSTKYLQIRKKKVFFSMTK